MKESSASCHRLRSYAGHRQFVSSRTSLTAAERRVRERAHPGRHHRRRPAGPRLSTPPRHRVSTRCPLEDRDATTRGKSRRRAEQGTVDLLEAAGGGERAPWARCTRTFKLRFGRRTQPHRSPRDEEVAPSPLSAARVYCAILVAAASRQVDIEFEVTGVHVGDWTSPRPPTVPQTVRSAAPLRRLPAATATGVRLTAIPPGHLKGPRATILGMGRTREAPPCRTSSSMAQAARLPPWSRTSTPGTIHPRCMYLQLDRRDS